MKKVIACFLILGTVSASAQKVLAKKEMHPLFNHKDLTGWYSFLATKGKDNDVEKVFVVEDSLLHISGKEFGYICTHKEFTNFHLAAEFKWGTKKYPPRDADTTKRDNGICYYFSPLAKDTVWPVCFECQVQEGDVGDIWMVGNTTMVVKGVRSIPKDYQRIKKNRDAEKPTGEWNRLEIIANKGKVSYIVNGVIVNEGESLSISKGKILVQSEGAEIFYRKIDIAEL